MAAKQIIEGLWEIGPGAVNAFVLDQGELTLIDTGLPKSEWKIVEAIEGLGKEPGDVRHTTSRTATPTPGAWPR